MVTGTLQWRLHPDGLGPQPAQFPSEDGIAADWEVLSGLLKVTPAHAGFRLSVRDMAGAKRFSSLTKIARIPEVAI